MAQMNREISERIIQKAAKTTNTDPLDLPPLYEAVDPDALNALVAGMSDGAVSFTYTGHEFTVTSNEQIRIADQPPSYFVGDPPMTDN